MEKNTTAAERNQDIDYWWTRHKWAWRLFLILLQIGHRQDCDLDDWEWRWLSLPLSREFGIGTISFIIINIFDFASYFFFSGFSRSLWHRNPGPGIQDISYHHDFWPFYFYYHLWWVWWILKFILIIIILTLGILWLSLLLWKSVITFSIIINWWLNWDRGKFLFFELCEFLQGIRRGKVVENLLEKPQSQAPNPCP